MKSLATVVVLALLLIYAAAQALFTVDPTQQALVLRFGEPVRNLIEAPGLYLKWPFVENVVHIDKRILALEVERQEVLVAGNQRLEVDAFLRYRISDPLAFYQRIGIDPRTADTQLSGVLNSALRASLSGASITDIVRDRRDDLMAAIRDHVRAESERFGIAVLDVRIKRADLPPDNSEAVFRRMQTERQQIAAGFRAQGRQRGLEIRAEADRKATVIEAEAQRDSEKIRGQGEGERNRIFAEAYGRDPDFFGFYRSMQAYETALKTESRIVLSPKSQFFRFFDNAKGSQAKPKPEETTP